MRRVAWSEEARAEFRDIMKFIADDNPHAAERVARRIRAAIAKLRYLNNGRIGRVEGTFEKLVPKTSHILVYSVQRSERGQEELFIVHIIHAARDWPPGEWPKS